MWSKLLNVTPVLEIGCNYSILNHKRINYKICFLFQGVDNTGVFYKSRDKVVPLKLKQYFFMHKISRDKMAPLINDTLFIHKISFAKTWRH